MYLKKLFVSVKKMIGINGFFFSLIKRRKENMMKELISELKNIKGRLDTLYSTQYVLSQKGSETSDIDALIADLEARKAELDELVIKKSLIK